MLERLIIRNFKRFDEVEIELGERVLFIGPNNSGKTTALQALALWDLGLKRWSEKRLGANGGGRRTRGVAIGRREIVSVPVPETHLFWRDRRVRRKVVADGGRSVPSNIRFEIEVRGVDDGERWTCGLEFDFANSESIYCRPLGALDSSTPAPELPAAALHVNVAYLPPMSGLTASETRLDPGAVAVRLGEGRTAEVLRNLCYLLASRDDLGAWNSVVRATNSLFGVELEAPVYIPERGEISMSYRERSGARLDLTAAGRGLQQTLLLLAHLELSENSLLLLDEPDAHLEILRQRQIYNTLAEAAERNSSQLIAASHSEVLLNEAADRDVVVAFVGKPHRIDDRGTQAAKSLKSIGFEAFAQAEQTGWVLYLEGSTDLQVLRAFAEVLEHPVQQHLERPFVQYIGNRAAHAQSHFFGLREAKNDLVGFVLLDRQEEPLGDRGPLRERVWSRREIENYLCFPEVLESYAARSVDEERVGPLFASAVRRDAVVTMRRCIEDRVPPVALRDRTDPWWRNVKASNDFLDPVFEDFFRRMELPNLMRKTDYHVLASHVPREQIDDEVSEVLDAIAEVAGWARPVEL